MASVNRVILLGNLTRDIEIHHTKSEIAVGKFGLAMNHKYKDKEETVFVDCTAWGKTAEVMAQHLHKGDPVFVEGRLSLDQWEDKNGGGKRSKLYVTVDTFQFMPRARGDGEASAPASKPAAKGDDGWGDSDIPF